MDSKVKKELMFILPKLRRYCYGLTGNKDQGDDLLHDSIVKILNKFSINFIKIDNLSAFMYKLISNTWKDQLRKKYKQLEIKVDDIVYNNLPDNNQNNNFDSNINNLSIIEDSIKSLSVKLREVIMLVALENKSYKETSEILKIPIGTVMSRLNEARKKLIEFKNFKSGEKEALNNG